MAIPANIRAAAGAWGKRYGSAAMMAVDLERATQLLGIAMDDALGKIAADLTAYVIPNTPVDTGAAANSWSWSRDMESADPTPNPGDAGAAATREAASAFNLVRLGPAGTNHWWLASVLPYIEPLEFGYSKKAPAGMVRLAVARVVAEIEDVMDRALRHQGLA